MSMVKSGRGSKLYLLTGLAIGFILAYIASCTVLPLEYYDINPASLHRDLKKDYFVLIADAFSSNADIGRAAARVNALLENPNVNDLRILQFEIESDDRYFASAESVRELVNHLDVYLRTIGDGSMSQPAAPIPIQPTAPLELPLNETPESDFMIGIPDGG